MRLFHIRRKRGRVMKRDPLLVKLLETLRFGSADPPAGSPAILNYSSIARVTGLSASHVARMLKASPQLLLLSSISPLKKWKKLTSAHIGFLCSQDTLLKWAHLSLQQRAVLFHR